MSMLLTASLGFTAGNGARIPVCGSEVEEDDGSP